MKSIQEFVETFSYFYINGSGVELFMSNRTEFEKLISIAKKNFKRQSLGGNAVTMAYRAFIEGTDVLLGAEINKQYYK